jgi:hypothetical protein
MYTTFCNFLCITVRHIYNKNNQTVVSIHTGFLTYVALLYTGQKPVMDRNYCLIVFIVYMSYSDTYIESCKMFCTWTKIDVRKKGGWAIRGTIGSCPQVPVICTRPTHWMDFDTISCHFTLTQYSDSKATKSLTTGT